MEPLNSNKLHSDTRKLAALPTLVQQVSDSATAALLDSVGQLLANCDDIYFALAEKATSNNEQSMFFESLREVRLQKDNIVARFNSELRDCFETLAPGPKAPSAATELHGTEPLSLVPTAELEKNVALSSMIAKSRVESSEQLYYLNKRFDFLIKHSTVNENNNPLDPAQLCAAFSRATEVLDIDIKARIVLFKQFERVTLGELPGVCAEANQQLIDAGVLPTIARTVRGAQTSPRFAQDTAASAPTADLAQLSQLLSSLRVQALREQLSIPMFFSTNGGRPIADKELNTLLSDLQSQATEPAATGSSVREAIDIRGLLKNILQQRKTQGKTDCLSKPDEDIINLVAMFFDFVLEDRQLPTHAQALIGRLQFPVLKIALQDKTFFSNSRHPARQLINEMVNASIGMADSEAETSNALCKKLTDIVQTINNQQESNENIFALALTELKQYHAIEDSKAAKIEKRTCDTAQAEAMTTRAKAAIRDLVFERLKEVKVPELIQDFLVSDWQQVMFLARLKYGEQSPEEVEVEQTMDDLIWSSMEHGDDKSQQRLQGLLPELQQRLRKWLAQTAQTEDSMEQTLQPVLALHAQLAEPRSSAAVARSKLAEDQTEALHPAAEQHKTWNEMTALERQQVEYKDLTYSFIKQADDFPIGTWFSVNSETSENIVRCKLAAKLAANDSYVFVNRLGFKVLEMKRKDFAFNLQQQRAKPLQSEQFFERTLGKVVGQLQQLAGAITQTAQHSQT
ncbi:MAG: DUF1631 domain-containing protein [Pseudomonadales bacterium]